MTVYNGVVQYGVRAEETVLTAHNVGALWAGQYVDYLCVISWPYATQKR